MCVTIFFSSLFSYFWVIVGLFTFIRYLSSRELLRKMKKKFPSHFVSFLVSRFQLGEMRGRSWSSDFWHIFKLIENIRITLYELFDVKPRTWSTPQRDDDASWALTLSPWKRRYLMRTVNELLQFASSLLGFLMFLHSSCIKTFFFEKFYKDIVKILILLFFISSSLWESLIPRTKKNIRATNDHLI